MHIHYKYAQHVVRYVPCDALFKKPTAELAQILLDANYDSEYFYTMAITTRDDDLGSGIGYDSRSLISDTLMYFSDLYTAERGRGRKGDLQETRTKQMGIMLLEQERDALNLTENEYEWIADCKAQEADLASRTVHDLIDNDAVYVSGPSGMITCFLNQMELLVNFQAIKYKQLYLLCSAVYTVCGGFHSWHEVLGPAEYALKLIPGYLVQVPDIDNNTKAPPPNYYQFFSRIIQVDKYFHNLWETGWNNLIFEDRSAAYVGSM